MERLYRVTFDTQRDRRYITWGFYVLANNQKEAKEAAYDCWNSKANTHYSYGFSKAGKWHNVPHMYHVTAQRVSDKKKADRRGEPVEILTFYVIENKYASWGYAK